MRWARRCAASDDRRDTVFINLGANDVCQGFGHDYTGDLQRLPATSTRRSPICSRIPPGGARIYWTGIPNIVAFRNVMASRRHNYIFRSCQATWDLDSDEITEEAAASLCHAAGFPDTVCTTFANSKSLRDRLMQRFLDYYQDRYNVDEGPCGRVLNSANTAA